MKRVLPKKIKFNRSSVFHRIFLTTMAVALLPVLLIYIYVYFQTTEIIVQQTEKIDAQMLSKTQESAELACYRLQQSTASLANSSDAIMLAFLPTKDDWTIIQRMATTLSTAVRYDRLISSIYLYSGAANKILTSDMRYYSVQDFYDISWLEECGETAAGSFWTGVRVIDTPDGTSQRTLSLIAHIPSGSIKNTGAIVVNLDLDAFYEDILDSGSPSASHIQILSAGLEPLVGNTDLSLNADSDRYSWILEQQAPFGSQSLKTNRTQAVFSYRYSPLYNWYFVCESLVDLTFDTYINVIPITVAFLICLTLGLGLAYGASRKIYRPVGSLVATVLGENSFSDEYERLRSHYSQIQSQNSSLSMELDRLRPILTERFFGKLVWGQVEDPEKALETLDSNFTAHHYAVLILQCTPLVDLIPGVTNLPSLQVRRVIESTPLPSNEITFICLETGSNALTVVYNFPYHLTPVEARQKMLQLSALLQERVSAELGLETTTGFSTYCENIAEVPYAYQMASKTVRFKLYQDPGELSVEDDDTLAEYAELLHAINAQICTGTPADVETALEALVAAVRSNLPRLTQLQIQQIFTQAANAVIELLITNKLSVETVFGQGRNLFAELVRREDLLSIHAWMRPICLNATVALQQAHSRLANKKVARIMEYIEQHLSEDLSLNDVADWINLSPAYVSRIFKESSGENFVDYLGGLRVAQAKLLLDNTHLSIKEVGFKCGFNNMQTFIRVFKKVVGSTPSQYRDI